MDPRKIVRAGLRALGLLLGGIAILIVLAIVADTFMSNSPWEEEYEREIQDLERNLEFPVPITDKEGAMLIPTDEREFHPNQELPPPST